MPGLSVATDDLLIIAPSTKAAFILPSDTQRTAVIGRTGSGKTQAGLWQLSLRNFSGNEDSMPWIIFDFKGDALIADLKAKEQLITMHPPTKPGLYVVRPLPGQEELFEAYLWNIWYNGDTGIFIDEGYMVRSSNAFLAILTQGRSKNIPVILLAQRPSFISRFVWSEADYFQVFELNDDRDYKTVRYFVRYDFKRRLPPYHSIWYDIAQARVSIIRPVPGRDEIAESINIRVDNRRKYI
jgi:hypothetical protein